MDAAYIAGERLKYNRVNRSRWRITQGLRWMGKINSHPEIGDLGLFTFAHWGAEWEN